MYELNILIIILFTFLLAGTVKGVIGLGLPTVSLGLLTAALDLPTAMALLLVPSFVTNTWQAMAGGNGIAILRRTWSFLLLATATVWVGAIALTTVNLSVLSGILGTMLAVYSVISLAGIRLTINKRQEVWAGPIIGVVNGILTGMTGSFVVPGVMFLQAIGLPRDMLVQAMGMLFTASTAALAVALSSKNLLSFPLGILSAAALVPALIGMIVGQNIRKRLPEALFHRVFFAALFVLGVYIIANSIFRFR